jgi:polyisoprenoid-binding protein YceI
MMHCSSRATDDAGRHEAADAPGEVAGVVNRKGFGLTWNRALDTGGFLVGDEVRLQIAVDADKAMPAALARTQ